MSEWLTIVLNRGETPPPTARFARDSAWNWMAALDWEVRKTHGDSVAEQVSSCDNHFAGESLLPSVRKAGGKPNPALLARVIEPLYGSAVFATALVDLALTGTSTNATIGPWHGPNVIVGWYYASYNAVRAMLTACGGSAPKDTHAGVGDALQGPLRERLPHPFNMVATWDHGEDFTPQLPALPGVHYQRGMHLIQAFSHERAQAQQMLLSYLGGTSTYYVDKLKKKLLESPEFTSSGLKTFRSKDAKKRRDAALQRKAYNFLHLAYRYRGKANYRDFAYFSYGASTRADIQPFLLRLASTARFLHFAAVAYVGQRLGRTVTGEFTDDMRRNYRGFTRLTHDLPRP